MSDETADRYDPDTCRGIHSEEKDGRMSFRVPVAGRVVVRNHAHDDAEEHTYVVEVEGVEPVSCSCPSWEFNNYSGDECKHMAAVAAREPVVAAACGVYGRPEDYRDETTEDPQVATDGGTGIESRDPSPRESAAVDQLLARRGLRGDRW